MAKKLTNCPDCGKLVSKLAKACPDCGRPLKKSGGPKEGLFLRTLNIGCGVVLLLLVAAMIAVGVLLLVPEWRAQVLAWIEPVLELFRSG